MNIVFTGKIKETRKELEASLNRGGHQLQKKVEWNTNLLVIGKRKQALIEKGMPKSKKELAADSKGIKTIHVESLTEMIQYLM